MLGTKISGSFWGSRFGRSDWFWYGSQSSLVYWDSWLGEWALGFGTGRRFGLLKLEAMMKEDERVSEENNFE